MGERRKGALYAVAAHAIWGLFPLYWPLLKPAGAVEILAHRVVWSFVLLVILVARLGTLRELRAIGARRFRLLALAAALISMNWGLYIWAVNRGQVVETSLGYFITPLVSVLLGVVFLRERLRRAQWIAVATAAAAVLVLTLGYGRPPWIAFVLACSFGLYGFVKKTAGVGALPSLTVETALLFVPALGYLASLQLDGSAAFAHVSFAKSLLLAGSVIMTAIPLLCFAAAANRIPLVTIGLLQYLSPAIQLVIGIFVFHEPMPAARWIGFALIWAALALFSVDLLSRSKVAAEADRA